VDSEISTFYFNVFNFLQELNPINNIIKLISDFHSGLHWEFENDFSINLIFGSY